MNKKIIEFLNSEIKIGEEKDKELTASNEIIWSTVEDYKNRIVKLKKLIQTNDKIIGDIRNERGDLRDMIDYVEEEEK